MREVRTKWCPGCRRDLPVGLWGKRVGSPDGLQYRCKECCRRSSAANRALRAEAKQIAMRRLLRDPEVKELLGELEEEVLGELKAAGHV